VCCPDGGKCCTSTKDPAVAVCPKEVTDTCCADGTTCRLLDTCCHGNCCPFMTMCKADGTCAGGPSPQCVALEDKYCADVKGQGKDCQDCLKAHHSEFRGPCPPGAMIYHTYCDGRSL
jgi:hypothetical protein